MQRANAKNMLYMLSVQMAAMYLNLEMGYVSYSSYIQTKGCSWANFTNTYSLIWSTHYYLLFNATGADRSYAECLKTSFDNANNNLTFAQPSPCSGTITTAAQRKPEKLTNLVEAKVWPNPSNSYFNITPGMKSGETVEIRVMDVNGRQVYTAVGSANMNYRFGDKLIAGLYFVEIRQGTARSTIKVVKQ